MSSRKSRRKRLLGNQESDVELTSILPYKLNRAATLFLPSYNSYPLMDEKEEPMPAE
jgi:hypothetical protein